MGFDIMSLQKGRGTAQARSKADEGRAVLKYIDVEDLVPSEDNFYSMSAIDELAGLIELSGGVKQPGLVVPLGGGKYKVLSGHRRRLASLQLVKQGKEAYRKMPCMVEDAGRDAERDADADELRAIDEAILLITTNGQREKTDWDKVQEATRLRALLERKRQFEKIPGETRKIIDEQLGTTPAQIGRYDSIEKHLIPVFKGWLEKEKIGISVAYELSMLPEEVQEHAAAALWSKGAPVTLEDVRKWKPVEPEPPKAKRDEQKPAEDSAPPSPPPVEAVDEPEQEWQDVEREETPPALERTAGKIVDFPAPPSLTPAPSAETVKKTEVREKNKKWAANILEGLKTFCGEMHGIDAEEPETWAERADALDVAIAALRR